MDVFVQQVVSGVSSGMIYASVALSLVMVYNATGHINFAQGEMAMFSTYVAWTLIDLGMPYPAAFLLTVVLSFLGGVAIERIVLRPLHRAPVMSIIVVAVGLLLAVNAAAGWIWGFLLKEFPSPVRSWSTGSTMIGMHDLYVLAITLGLFLALFAFFRFTPLGLAMRAAAQNPTSARLVGVRVDRMLALGWGLAAAIGAAAGMLVAPIVFLDPNMMAGILLYAFAAALFGGLSSPGGAVVGGLFVGVTENLVGTFVIGNELKLSFALVIVIGVLIFKPSGLFGRARVKRV